MPSAAYEKAQQILTKAEQIRAEMEAEKTAGPRPDVLPALKRLIKKHDDDPPPTKYDKALNYGVHALGGAGAAKFTGDAVETGLAALHQHAQKHGKPGFKIMNEKWYEGKLPPRVKAGILATGATLGIAHKLRKEHRRKTWKKENAMKKVAVSNLGAEERAQTEAKVLTRAATRAEAETLFDQANVAKAKAQRQVKGLFAQAEGAETMAPMLAKTASLKKLAKIFGEHVPGESYHGAIPYRVRKELHGKYLKRKAKEEPTGYGKAGLTGAAIGAGLGGLLGAGHGRVGVPVGAMAGGALGGLFGLGLASDDHRKIEHAKKHSKSSKGVDRSIASHVAHHELAKDMAAERRHQEMLWEMRQHKYASVDSFFDKLAYSQLTEAQRRYPELLKVSAAPGGAGTRPTVSLKPPKSARPSTAMMSGGTP